MMGKEFHIYSTGLFYASVCSSLSLKRVKARMKRELCGTEIGWTFAGDEAFSGGDPNPSPCERRPETHIHYLFEA